MIVCIQAFKGLFFLVTFLTKEKVVTVLTHVAVWLDLDFTCETLVFFVLVDLRLE
jgi:hypothetical protein